MANWTVATTLERLSDILVEEKVIPVGLLDLDGAGMAGVSLEDIVDTMKERIVRDQFTPKAKAQHRARTEAKPATKTDG